MCVCAFVCIIKIHVAHEVKNQRVVAKRTSQIMECGQDVIMQKRTDFFYINILLDLVTSIQ